LRVISLSRAFSRINSLIRSSTPGCRRILSAFTSQSFGLPGVTRLKASTPLSPDAMPRAKTSCRWFRFLNFGMAPRRRLLALASGLFRRNQRCFLRVATFGTFRGGLDGVRGGAVGHPRQNGATSRGAQEQNSSGELVFAQDALATSLEKTSSAGLECADRSGCERWGGDRNQLLPTQRQLF
jgi:hypothetical protein